MLKKCSYKELKICFGFFNIGFSFQFEKNFLCSLYEHSLVILYHSLILTCIIAAINL
jgi:hypothetical protein